MNINFFQCEVQIAWSTMKMKDKGFGLADISVQSLNYEPTRLNALDHGFGNF